MATPEYRTYQAMKSRCYNKNHVSYKRYGGRGILICERWLNGGFNLFYEDMGPKPTPYHSIDRIDNSKGYYPDNCRWATPKEQITNRRNKINISCSGHTKSLAAWALFTGLSYSFLWGLRSRKDKRLFVILRHYIKQSSKTTLF